MEFTTEQMEYYKKQGWLSVPTVFSEKEISAVQAEISALTSANLPGSVFENDGKTLRALHGCHQINQVLHCLTMHPSFLEPVKQLLNSEVYVHQFKVNFKSSFSGDLWQWHQDYVFWHKEDEVPAPRMISVSLFLDEVNEFNGPIYLIPGSHQYGILCDEIQPASLDTSVKSDWTINFSTSLKFTVRNRVVSQLVNKHGILAPKGPRGTVLFLHSNLVHSSAPNISPYNRNLLFITYNSVENKPQSKISKKQRPEFLVSRDYTPLSSVAEDTILKMALPR